MASKMKTGSSTGDTEGAREYNPAFGWLEDGHEDDPFVPLEHVGWPEDWTPQYTVNSPSADLQDGVGGFTAGDGAFVPNGVKATGAPGMWKNGITGKDIRIAVIDSGIDDRHPALKGKVVRRIWYRRGGEQFLEHGTHVAGTIAASGNDSSIKGVAPDALLHDYCVFGSQGDVSVDTAITLAIEQAVKDGCHIINMSLGGGPPRKTMHDAIKDARNKGLLVCVSAGNNGDGREDTPEINYPAYWPECLSVGAVKLHKGEIIPTSFTASNSSVDVCAHGSNVISTKRWGSGYQIMSGTSMACPTVAGFAALKAEDILRYRVLKRDLLRGHVVLSTLDVFFEGHDRLTGDGFVTALEKLPSFSADIVAPGRRFVLKKAKIDESSQ